MVSLADNAIPAGIGSIPDHTAAPERERGSVVANRFIVCAPLGENRFGRVYEAIDRTWSDGQLGLEQHVALHVLDEGFRAQTRLLRKLETSYLQPHLWTHPNIVKILGFGADRETYFVATELLEGSSLRSVLEEHRPSPLSPHTAFTILQSVGDALTYAHGKGVVHGHIRPETVFVTNEQRVKVLDLLPSSVARSTAFFVEDTEPNGLANPDPRDDVYGLACLAYELLAGRHPFDGATALEALSRGLAPAPIADLAPERRAALARGLALRRAERTQSVADFLNGLRCGNPLPEIASAQPAAAAAEAVTTPVAHDTSIALIDDAPPSTQHDGRASTRRSTAPARRATPSDFRIRPAELRERWAPSEPVIAPRDIQPYRTDARRRRDRDTSRSSLPFVSIVVIMALGTTAYMTYEPLEAPARQLLEATGRQAGRVAYAAGFTVAPETESMAARDALGPNVSGSDASDAIAPPESIVESPIVTADALPAVTASAESTTEPAPAADAAPMPAAEESKTPLTTEAGATEPATPDEQASDPAASDPEHFELAAEVVTISESEAAATAVIERRGGNLGTASVTWWTSDGTAVAGEDYADLGRQTASFAAGEPTSTILVPIIADHAREGREHFYINVAIDGAAETSPSPERRLEVIITDDDS